MLQLGSSVWVDGLLGLKGVELVDAEASNGRLRGKQLDPVSATFTPCECNISQFNIAPPIFLSRRPKN